MTDEMEFVELDKRLHNRKTFDCGDSTINRFLQQSALRHRQAGISKTLVLVDPQNSSQIQAFYTLTHTEAKREHLPQHLSKKLPHYPIPLILIAQLAVHREYQHQGLGKTTLIAAMQHAHRINPYLPSYAVAVDAAHSDLIPFYTQFGFSLLENATVKHRLFIPMKTLQHLFA